MKLEHKFTPLDADIGEAGAVSGYASRFDIMDRGGDVVKMGAFSGRSNDVAMLYQHDPGQVIGVWDSVEEDEKGLRVSGRINLGSSLGRDVHSNLKFGAVKGMSIGYRIKTAEKVNGVRELRSVDLWEVSFVTFPMLPEALVDSVKDIDGANPAMLKRFVEGLLREAEFSADEAKAAAAAVARVRAEREASDEPTTEAIQMAFRNAFTGL